MSDWEFTENYIKQHNYIPQNISWNEYIASVLLHYEGDLESENLTENELPLKEWLENMKGNYRFEDFDY